MLHIRKIFVITLFLSLSAFCLFVYITNAEQASSFVVADEVQYPTFIIDAGHGGEDGGAVASDGTVEKNINLNIALQTQQFMQLLGFDCIMTRTDDSDLADHTLPTIRKRKISDINARFAIMESAEDAVYISIHQNQYADRSVSGLQVFYSSNHANSKSIAESVQNNVKSILQNENTRKVKAADENIYLLYHAKIPAVMIECGFMSNPTELEMLKNQTYGTKLVLSIAGGLIDYYENKGVS